MAEESPDQNAPFWRKRTNLGLTLAVSALLALFAWVLIAQPDKFYADDSYFYFQVAWNFARGMGSTFNNVMPTNGYHPLWMLICAAVFKVVPSKTEAVHAIAAVIVVLDALMLLTVRRLLVRVARNLWPIAFVLLIPFCFLSQLGTEGALSGLFLALLMLSGWGLRNAASARTAVLFNLVAAIVVLSRLDNIFIVGFVWLAMWIWPAEADKQRLRRLQLATLPIYVALWGTYIGSNWIYFHTLEPISGLLKSHSVLDHALGSNLSHTAWFALITIAICFAVMARWKCDDFFRTIEVPFALGVVCHAAYILLRMSSETRWSWYYTSWILLAAVLLARAAGVLFAERRWLVMPTVILCVLVLAGAWVRIDFQKYYLGPDTVPPASFNTAVYEKAGIHNAFAYDQPGLLAYYSDVHIVPLDGLMGNLQFQHDLATKGIAAVMAEDHIDGFIGPPASFDNAVHKSYCDRVYLMSQEFHCTAYGDETWWPTSVDIYARLPFVLSGTIALNKDRVVWTKKDLVTVWKVSPPQPTLVSGKFLPG